MSAAAAIEVKELRKRFVVGMGIKKRVALDGMNFRVEAGEVYGFLGPNGAGKTTSIKVLTSLLRADSGEAKLFGRSPTEAKARRHVGFLPESPVFYEHLTGREFLHFCGKLADYPDAKLKARASELLEKVGLAKAADLQIRRYSKGMTQRIGIAQALLHDPDLVILDEPMSGLDPMGRADIRDLILDLRRAGKTVFFSTHIIPDVEAICGRIGIVNRGRMIRVGTVGELLSEATSGETEVLVQSLPPEFAHPWAKAEVEAGGRRLFVVPTGEGVASLLAQVLSAKATVVSVTPRRESLEDLVVRLLANAEAKS